MSKIALVTGATSGIGKASATLLSQRGYDIIACGRREERLDELSKSLGTRVKKLLFDVRDKEDVFNAIGSLDADWSAIDVLVNNAGNAHGLASVEDASLEDWDAMIDINVKGLMYVTKAVLPLLLKQKAGHIINIGSVAGKEVYPNGNAYCASKHAVQAFNDALRLDLNGKNIKVSQIAPGLVETEFSLVRFKGDEEKADKVYEGYEALKPHDIAEIVEFMVSRPSHVNIADVLVFPQAQASSTIVDKH